MFERGVKELFGVGIIVAVLYRERRVFISSRAPIHHSSSDLVVVLWLQEVI